MAAVYYSIRYLKEQPRCRLRKGKYSISTYIPKRKNQVRIINKLSTYQHFINKLSTKKKRISQLWKGAGAPIRAREGGSRRLAGD